MSDIARIVKQTVDEMLPNIIQTVRIAVEETCKFQIENLEKKIDHVKDVVDRDRVLRQIAQEKLKQNSRRENIRVLGIIKEEENEEEDLINAMQDITAAINAPIEAPISAIHRLRVGRKGLRPRAIIVRFAARRDRARILTTMKKLKDNEQVKTKQVFRG